MAGLDLVREPMGNPFATGWYSVPTMSFFAYGWVTRILGATIAGGRALSVLLGSATVVLLFFLARLMDGRWIGWWSAVMLTVSAYHIHFSRLASNQIGDPLIGTLGLGLLWLGYNAGDHRRLREAAWGLAGVVAGLGWYGYFGARWVTIMIALFLMWRILADPSFVIRHRRALGLSVLGGLIALLPLLGWYQAHPSALTERYNAVSIFASGWLSREQELTGRSAVFLMGQQLWKAFTAFHLTPDPTFWYRPGRPLVDFVTGALLLIGIAVAFFQMRRPSRGVILVWFFSTVLMAWGMTENPPSSQRGLLLAPVVSLLAAWGLREALQILELEQPARLWVASGVLVVILVLNVGFYFAVYTPTRVYGNPTAEIATAIGHYQRDNPHPICAPDPDELCEGRVYFLGAPSLYWHFGTLAYLAADVPGEDILPGERPASVVSPARFILTPNRVEDLTWIESSYPGGERTPLRAPDGQLLAIIYDGSAP
jgi:4-amino-4-deoxy-L-arabinose transferase-like glycosyltransferase